VIKAGEITVPADALWALQLIGGCSSLFHSKFVVALWQRRLRRVHEIIKRQVKEHLMTMHAFSSFNQAQAIADKYARTTERTMYVVYEAHEFHVATEEDLSTFFAGLSDNQVRYCTADTSPRDR
jgi:hypothetical protein